MAEHQRLQNNLTKPRYTLRKKKGTRAVNGAVPFQKLHLCTLLTPKGAYYYLKTAY